MSNIHMHEIMLDSVISKGIYFKINSIVCICGVNPSGNKTTIFQKGMLKLTHLFHKVILSVKNCNHTLFLCFTIPYNHPSGPSAWEAAG